LKIFDKKSGLVIILKIFIDYVLIDFNLTQPSILIFKTAKKKFF